MKFLYLYQIRETTVPSVYQSVSLEIRGTVEEVALVVGVRLYRLEVLVQNGRELLLDVLVQVGNILTVTVTLQQGQGQLKTYCVLTLTYFLLLLIRTLPFLSVPATPSLRSL